MPSKQTEDRRQEIKRRNNLVPTASCIECTAGLTADGYGQFRYNGGMRKSHKDAYAKSRGIEYKDCPEVVRHTCDYRPCVNPGHLVEGTVQDNVQDRVSRDRCATNERNGNAKYSRETIAAIRADACRNISALSRKYGVSRTQIRRIRNNVHWVR